MTKASVYTMLFCEIVLDELSPYHQMLKKLDDIEADYFCKTPHWDEQPPTGMDFQIKEQAIKDFGKLTDDTLNKALKDTANAILEYSQYEISEQDWVKKNIGFIKQQSLEYFEQIKTYQKIDEPFLQRLYNKAMSACSEGNEQGISGYNKGFHHALLHNTIWECKELIERRIIQFLVEVISEAVLKYTTNYRLTSVEFSVPPSA